MTLDWQNVTALVVVALAAAWAGRMLLASMNTRADGKSTGCAGCCGCHKTPEDRCGHG